MILRARSRNLPDRGTTEMLAARVRDARLTGTISADFKLDESGGDSHEGAVPGNVMTTSSVETLEGTWTVRWPGGKTAQITVYDGYFSVFGTQFRLYSTDPISFTWADGTVQKMIDYTDDSVTWTTTNDLFGQIYWDRKGP